MVRLREAECKKNIQTFIGFALLNLYAIRKSAYSNSLIKFMQYEVILSAKSEAK